jgi:hypothetical protein
MAVEWQGSERKGEYNEIQQVKGKITEKKFSSQSLLLGREEWRCSTRSFQNFTDCNDLLLPPSFASYTLLIFSNALV